MELLQKKYTVNKLELQVTEVGSAGQPVILFLHGFPETSEAWHHQLQFFARSGFYAVAPDQRGYNTSSKPHGVKAYTLTNLSADIAALIRQLTTGKVYLVGHDWGGAVAWAMAIHHPALIQKLIILNMPHPSVMHQHLESNPAQQLKSWYTGFFQMPWLPELLCQAFNFKWLKKSLIKTALPTTFSAEKLANYQKAWQQPGALTAMINWYRAHKYNSLPVDKPVKIPTLLIWGKKDIFLGAEMAEPSIQQCSQGKLEFIEDATHWLHHEKPDLVNQLILAFIRPA